MKIISTIMLTLGAGVALMSSTTAPSASTVTSEKKEMHNQISQIARVQAVQPTQQELNGTIKVIAPQKDLESAVRNSEKGDVLLLGQDGWYRIEGRALQQGTKVYILGGQGSMTSVFPKEAEMVR
jgi:hypothetical protein